LLCIDSITAGSLGTVYFRFMARIISGIETWAALRKAIHKFVGRGARPNSPTAMHNDHLRKMNLRGE